MQWTALLYIYLRVYVHANRRKNGFIILSVLFEISINW